MKNLLQAISESGTFLLTCLGVFLLVVLLAWLFEHITKTKLRRPRKTRYIAFIAMSAAISGVLMSFEIPLFFAPSFYQLDLSEVPVLITSFYLGPVAGVITELLKIVIKILLKGTSTAFVGDFANFIVGCSFVLPASVLYHIHKSKKMAIVGTATGTAIMTIFGSLFNAVYLIPTFSTLFNLPLDAIVGMGNAINPHIDSVATLVLLAVVPFNLVKGIVVSTITFLLYKRLERVLARIIAQ